MIAVRPIKQEQLKNFMDIVRGMYNKKKMAILSSVVYRDAIDKGNLFMAYIGDKPVGILFMEYYKREPVAKLRQIASIQTPAGRILFEYAIRKAKEHGCLYMKLEVRQDNPDAIKFYERCGMKRAGEKTGGKVPMYIYSIDTTPALF